LCSQLADHGVSLQLPENGDSLPLHISGKLRGGDFFFSGDISSQYITGLLFALPLLEEDSRILLTSPLQSKGYVEMTLQLLKQ
ncbi:3-phosphoshikimate 1-carboxyvinyltransferase, partial [gut metagenome]